MRFRTENVPGIAGLVKAAELIYENHEEKITYQRDKGAFIKRVMEEIPDVKDNFGYAPHIEYQLEKKRSATSR